MGSMVGLAMAQDLMLMFVFWDLTADRLVLPDRLRPPATRRPRLGADGPARHRRHGGAAPDRGAPPLRRPRDLLRARARRKGGAGSAPDVAGLLIAVAGLAKSAQVPFHFWLPRAMAAPTPVSAYLHSAAMVAAGVLLLGRVYPLSQKSELLLDVAPGGRACSRWRSAASWRSRGTCSSSFSPTRRSPSTATWSLCTASAASTAPAGAAFYVVAHALAKSALFLTAGAVTEATGEDRLSRLGGLRKPMPLLAVASGVAAADARRAAPDVGFFKDELFFAAALERGPLFAGLAVVAAALTFAYTWRFWGGIFLGERRAPGRTASPAPRRARRGARGPRAPRGPLYRAFRAPGRGGGRGLLRGRDAAGAAYHLELRPENLMALGGVRARRLLSSRGRCGRGARWGLAARGDRGARAAVRAGRPRAQRLSDYVHRVEMRNLRGRVASCSADGGAGGGRGAGDADGRGVPGGGVPGGGRAADAGPPRGGGGGAHDDLYAPARHAGAGAVQRGLRARGGLRLLRGAGRGARGGPRRDDADAAPPRHLEADPLRVLHRQARAAAR